MFLIHQISVAHISVPKIKPEHIKKTTNERRLNGYIGAVVKGLNPVNPGGEACEPFIKGVFLVRIDIFTKPQVNEVPDH